MRAIRNHPHEPTPETFSVASAPSVIGYYVLYFATVGVTLPFLPGYFRGLGFTGAEIGVLLALSPLMALVSPPLFGHLADASGRTDRVLRIISFGALAAFVPLMFVDRFWPVFFTFLAYAFFASSITMSIDSLALNRVLVVGGSFARLRAFGSAGFVASTTAFGLWVDRIDRRTVLVPMAGIVLYAVWSLIVRARSAPAPRRSALSGLQLLRDRNIALLLAATCLHWIAFSPFNGTLAIHVTALGLPPSVVGMAAGLGVIAEIAVMVIYPRFAERIAPRHVLAFAFAATVLRWAAMAVVSSGPAIIALSLLHGLSFGAFYVASIGYMARRVPEHLRSSGQALYVAITFGIGGLFGYLGSGAGYDWLGGHTLFAVAAGVQAVTVVMALQLQPADTPSEFLPASPRPEGTPSA